MTTGPETPPAGPDSALRPAPPPPPPPPPPAPATARLPAGPAAPAGAYGVSSSAPYGIHPATGIPYSDKQKLIAGLLNILLPFGVGRFYIGDTKTGVLAARRHASSPAASARLWSLIDGIMMLVNDDTKDARTATSSVRR